MKKRRKSFLPLHNPKKFKLTVGLVKMFAKGRRMPFAEFRASYQGDDMHDAYFAHLQSTHGWQCEKSEWALKERPYEEWKVKEDGPGFVYFFRTVTKLGRTEKWSKEKCLEPSKNYRKGKYTGPSKPERVFFVRPVPRMREAEFQLKQFLLNLPGSPYYLASGNEWLLQGAKSGSSIPSQTSTSTCELHGLSSGTSIGQHHGLGSSLRKDMRRLPRSRPNRSFTSISISK